ncbi:MAG TPA: hypothetical protein VGP36_07640 [Mycobacteriales bacterium]|nr:hypothetical protein [Mycobacteriales bacterium]
MRTIRWSLPVSFQAGRLVAPLTARLGAADRRRLGSLLGRPL